MATVPATHVWNGTPIVYEPYTVPTYDGITLIPCLDYLWPDGTPRYVAIRNGEIIAVQTDYNGFCNMCVNPLWRNGGMRLFPPDYARVDGAKVYRVPYVREGAL